MIDNVNSHCASLKYALYPDPKQKICKRSSLQVAMLKRMHPTKAFSPFHGPQNAEEELGGKSLGKGRPMAAGTEPIHGLEIRGRL